MPDVGMTRERRDAGCGNTVFHPLLAWNDERDLET